MPLTGGGTFSTCDTEELIETEMRPGQEQRFNVWTDPEFGIYSPLVRGTLLTGGGSGSSGYTDVIRTTLRLSLPWRERIALGTEMTGSPDVGDFFFQALLWSKICLPYI